MIVRAFTAGFAGAVLLMGSIGSAQTVTKVAESFEFGGWRAGTESTAGGRVAVVDDDAGAADSKKALLIEPSFIGRFGGFGAEPDRPLLIPGETKSIKLRYKLSDKRFGIRVNFKDGWDRPEVGGKHFDWDIRVTQDGAWHTAEFKVPAEWVQPISISGIGTHNFSAQSETLKVPILVDQIEATTDLTNVDRATGRLKTWTPDPKPAKPEAALKQSPAALLRSVDLSVSAEGNVFAGTEPRANVRVQNWVDGSVNAMITVDVIDASTNQVVQTKSDPASFDSVAGFELPLTTPKFGLYTLRATADFGEGKVPSPDLSFAKIPKPRELTDAEKEASPYGLNYHAGGRLMFKPFRDAGIVWFREYSFGYDWLQRARGQGSFDGWPGYPRIVQAYEDAGAKVVGVFMKSIKPPAMKDGKLVGPLGPDDDWTRFIAEVMTKFPRIKNWEMSNEYDLPAENAAAERVVNWKNYQLYHAKLGELVSVLGNGKWRAIENGRAGIWPDLAKDCVASGHFAKIDVINTHHYCGTDAPEENLGNYNTSNEAWGGKPPTLLFDDLRNTTRAGRSDGKPRQHWHTEFGWDTLAGPIVTPYEQAVFLQRAWMLTMAAGVDKAFWFYHFDSKSVNNFFDGCGLFTWDAQPKLALASLAGMTSVLPSPKYVGSINAGPNTAGYVFEQDGKYVAALWTIRGDGPIVDLPAERVVDWLGNDISGKQVKLTMAPIFAIGIAKESSLFNQTAYSIDSDNAIVASLGDPIESTILIDNNRGTSIDCEITVTAPEGWQVETATQKVAVAATQKQAVAVRFTVGVNDTARERNVIIAVREAGQVVKEMPLRVLLQPRVALAIDPMAGEPGKTTLSVKVGNRSRRPVDGVVTFALPKDWNVADASLKVEALKPGEQRTVSTQLTWNANWQPGESAVATLDAGGTIVAKPIIPNRLSLHRAAPGMKIDGNLSEWSDRTQIPAWTLGSTHGDANATIHLAWSPEGISGAVDVRDSKRVVHEPRNFWNCDVFELFVDTGNDKKDRKFAAGDHQFFLVPQPAEGRAFVGRWKVNNEIKETQFDIKAVQSASKETKDGYVMEFFIPASELQNYQPGKPIGLNFNLTAVGQHAKREVFWSRSKATSVNVQPMNWGTADLVE